MAKGKGKRPLSKSRAAAEPKRDAPPPEPLKETSAASAADESSSRPSVADDRTTDEPELRERFSRMFVPPELYNSRKRKDWQLEVTAEKRGPYIVELNLQHVEGLSGADIALRAIHKEAAPLAPEPIAISKTYIRCWMTFEEWQRLLEIDDARATARAGEAAQEKPGGGDPMRYRAIYKLWPDFPVRGNIFRSMPTIKADAALKSYDAAGNGIVWAVIDSGIDGQHPHFSGDGHTLDAEEVNDLHRSFVTRIIKVGEVEIPTEPSNPDEAKGEERAGRLKQHRDLALRDDFGHGTHVAGVIAGSVAENTPVCALERVDRVNQGVAGRGQYSVVAKLDPRKLRGVAPRCRLVSLKVLDENGAGRSSDVIRALDYVREKLNDNPKLLRVHGVNLSVGYEFDAEMFACGQSPICAEVNRLVQSGVVVVAAAGNTGYGTVGAQVRPTKVGLSNTINDPGNAELAITVGATHRDAPHTYGVSYFSSKGPTGDGRLKPDLVAPGERITSCAAGSRKASALHSANSPESPGTAYYIEDSGTSMAAPHVSGAIAAFLSIRREFIGRPTEVKKIFCSTATPLGRERYFEGNGLVDLMRAIQSV
jgi:subtilisin family serine protease